jgi:ribosome-binding factor A
MPKEFSRMSRIDEEVQRAIAKLVQRECRDPRLGLITVCKVNVSKDFSHAKVLISSLNPKISEEDAAACLNESAKMLRLLLAKEVNLRVMPQLRFVYDDAVQKSAQLAALIEAAAPKSTEKDT